MKAAVRVLIVLALAVAGWFVYQGRQAAALNNQGVALLNDGRHAEAAATLEKARALDPKNPKTLKNLGAAYDALGDEEKALDAFEEAAIRWPTAEPQGFKDRLEQLRENGRLRQAAADRIEAMKAKGWKDDSATLEQTLAVAEQTFQVGNFKDAVTLYERALFKNADNLEIMLRIEALEKAMNGQGRP